MKSVKKVLAIILTLAMFAAMFGISASAKELEKLDLAFVVDTTLSMSDDINEVKDNMESYLRELDKSGMDYRIAIVDYRDFASRAASCDYPYCVQCDFTSDYKMILETIESLDLGNGGDANETVYSALIDGLNELSWRKEAGKSAIVMGDAPALDPEPITNYTLDDVKKALGYKDVEVKPAAEGEFVIGTQAEIRSAVTLFTIATTTYSSTIENFKDLAEATGGVAYTAEDSEDVSNVIETIIDVIPEVVETPTYTFWDKVKYFFINLYYLITFQYDLMDWSLCF